MSSEIIETLKAYLDKTIVIKLRNTKTVQGNLQDLDQGMNLILMESTDITNNDIINLGKIIIRGDNILMISLPYKSISLNLKDHATI